MKIYATKISDISNKMLDKLSLLITLEKRIRIERFISKEDKIRTLIGEILARTIASEEVGIRNKHIIFDKNQYGKPYLKNYSKFNFNISHSGDFVVCAIDDKSVGIDIEQVKHIGYEGIAESFFSTSEIEGIYQKDLYRRLREFYRIWTLKESYIKCCGQGLSIPLKSFSISIDTSDKIRAVIDNKYSEHTFNIFDIELDYKIAVCSINKETASDIIMVEQSNLINNFFDLQ